MTRRLRWLSSVLVVLLAAAFAGGAAAKDKKSPPGSIIDAAEEVVKAARAAEQGDSDSASALKAALSELRPYAKAVRKQALQTRAVLKERDFAVVWNEALTVARYHGMKPKGAYILRAFRFGWRDMQGGLPVSKDWKQGKPDGDQLIAQIYQCRPGGERMRHIKIWMYRWDTVYSGVGGENCKKLAKVMHELDRDSMTKKGRKASSRVKAKKLSAAFSRAQYYFVQGFDVDLEKTVRRRNYYVKADRASFNFEVIDILDPSEKDDPVAAWQRQDEGPELLALLTSFTQVEKE